MIDKTTTVSKTKLQKEEHQCATQSGSRPRAAPSRADAASWRTWQRPHRTHDSESIVRIVGRPDRRKIHRADDRSLRSQGRARLAGRTAQLCEATPVQLTSYPRSCVARPIRPNTCYIVTA